MSPEQSSTMASAMDTLFGFLAELESLGVHYVVGYYTAPEFGEGYRTLTVHVTASADQRWEVDFHDDGTVDIERFRSSGLNEAADLAALVDELQHAGQRPLSG